MSTTSSLKRQKTIKRMESRSYDILVIGGGITGAGIALDAASRGLSVALVEKDDFASGTSSRSTKLIHGGLRYLKQLEIGLVREVGHERATVHKLAPHLVIAEKMLLPLIEGGTYGKLATSFGLKVYDFLAGVEDEDKRVMLSKEETIAHEPLLRRDVLKGGGYYAEYRTDDARLTIEIIKLAASMGADCLNYVRAEQFRYGTNGIIDGMHCRDSRDDQEIVIEARVVVSAAGPWVDHLRRINRSMNDKRLFLSKGVHIVVPHERLPVNQAVYFDVPDGRMIFTIPRNRVTYIGTTDTKYEGDVNHVMTNQEDVDYLLDATNNMFPDVNLKTADVISSWAGLRPLIYEEGKSASDISRKDEIFESKTGLISIAGGKLTGYRKMAERVVDLAVKRLQQKYGALSLKECHTDTLELCPEPMKDAAEVMAYKKSLEPMIKAAGLDSYHINYLVDNYGKQTSTILEQMKKYASDQPEVALARAEVWFGVNNELVISPMDFFARRSGRLYFDITSIASVKSAVLLDLQNYFYWDQEEIKSEQTELDQALYEAANFPSLAEEKTESSNS